MKKYYAIQQAERAADIYIFGDITPWPWPELGEVSAMSIKDEIQGLDVDEIRVHIDSYGGSVSEAWGIYNALRQHPARIKSYGDGFVASAALYPFLAGDERYASSVSAYYLHQVIVFAEGYAEDLRAAADDAEIMTDVGINAFVERAGMDAETVKALMAGETWLTPQQALDYGIATALVRESGQKYAQSIRRGVIEQVLTQEREPDKEKPEEKTPEEEAREPERKQEREENKSGDEAAGIMQILSGVFMSE